MTCTAPAPLPHASCVRHDRSSVYWSAHTPPRRELLYTSSGEASHVSAALTDAAAGTALHSTVVFAGTPDNVGG